VKHGLKDRRTDSHTDSRPHSRTANTSGTYRRQRHKAANDKSLDK